MFTFGSSPTPAGTSPNEWAAGTYVLSVIRQQTGSSSTEANSGTSGTTRNYTGTAQSSSLTSQVYGPSSHRTEFSNSINISYQTENFYTPSTHTEVVPAVTTIPTAAASTATITDNYTETTVSSEFQHRTTLQYVGDTTDQSSFAESTGRTYNGTVDPVVSDTDGIPMPTTTVWNSTRTVTGANLILSSFASTVDYTTTKTGSTNTDTDVTWYNTAWTTASVSITTATNSTQPATSSTSWTLQFGTTADTTNTTSALTNPVTYSADITTYNTRTITSGTDTITGPVTSETVTLHAYAKSIDTVILMRGERNAADFTLGDMLWWFTHSSVPVTGSITGRMSDLFSTATAPTVTLSDYSRATTNSIAVTAITVSVNTATASTTTTTGTLPSTGTASTGTTVYKTSKNGFPWNASESHTWTTTGTGATSGNSAAASNTVTDNHTFNIGAVGTSLSTYEYGDPVSIASETIFTHSVQLTGSSDFVWTSTTTTEAFNSSSFTESRLALYSSTSTTTDIVFRSTTEHEALVDSYSSYLSGTDTSYFLLGKILTATTRVFAANGTTTRSIWDASYNREIRLWTTQTGNTITGGATGSTSAVSEFSSVTYHSEYRVTPQIRTIPEGFDGLSLTNGAEHSLDVARHQVLPNGYAGFGGSFAASSETVYFSVSSNLVSGSNFGTDQTINFSALPTMSIYDGVTMFQVQTGSRISIEGAANASYISTLASIGTASMAVTWTSTTTAGTSTLTTSREATYALAGSAAITGIFYSEPGLTFNSSNGFHIVGGYAIGDNAIGKSYQVRCRSGFAQWTEFKTSESSATSTNSTSGTAGTVTFSVPASHAIVLSIEPILTARWTGESEIPFYFSSTPHIPFE